MLFHLHLAKNICYKNTYLYICLHVYGIHKHLPTYVQRYSKGGGRLLYSLIHRKEYFILGNV